MNSVTRILRLRSAVRSDEMKAESTLPPAQPVSGRGMPTGWCIQPDCPETFRGPASRAEHMQAGRVLARVRQSTRLTAHEAPARQWVGLRRARRAQLLSGRTQQEGVRFH